MIQIQTSQAVNSIQEYYFSKKLNEINEMRERGINVINLGIGSPDLPPPQQVMKALSFFALEHDVHAYQTYKGIFELREAFSNWYNQYFKVKINPENEILPLMGSKAGIMHVSLAFLDKGDEVLIPNPAYPAYASVAKIIGAKPVSYSLKEENNWLPNFNELRKKDLSKVKIMWVNYPNMPTGQKATKTFFKELIDFGIENNILIVNDNPYSFILNEDYLSILSVEKAFDVAIELNSLSKSHNIAGWRMGAVFGNEKYISAIQKIQSNMISGMFLPIQKAVIEALKVEDVWYKNLNIIYEERRQVVWQILEQLKCKFDKSASGMFVWAKISDDYKDSFELSDFLLNKYKIFITPGGIFGSEGNKYVRISLCSSVETFNKVLDILKSKRVIQNQINN